METVTLTPAVTTMTTMTVTNTVTTATVTDDERLMSRALTLAANGINTTHPNPRVGCVIVAGGEVVGEGWHRLTGEAHAETIALQNAGERARGATAYVTLEPCSHHGRTPPCADALITAGIARAVIAMQDPNPQVDGGGIQALREAGIEVCIGVGESAARQLNRGFCKRMTENLPWVTVKLAVSLDGKTAMASGESQWITAPAARQDAHQLRAASSAILTGVGTVINDDPLLTARIGETVTRQTLRVIVDSKLRTPPSAKMLSAAGDTLIVTGDGDERAAKKLRGDKVEIISCADGNKNARVDLRQLMTELAAREINEVFVEAGAEINGNLLTAGLVDQLVIYMSPDLLGDSARGMFHLPALTELSHRHRLTFSDIKRIGDDLRLRLDVTPS